MEADSFAFGSGDIGENLLCTLAVLWESSESGLRQNFSSTVLSCTLRGEKEVGHDVIVDNQTIKSYPVAH